MTGERDGNRWQMVVPSDAPIENSAQPELGAASALSVWVSSHHGSPQETPPVWCSHRAVCSQCWCFPAFGATHVSPPSKVQASGESPESQNTVEKVGLCQNLAGEQVCRVCTPVKREKEWKVREGMGVSWQGVEGGRTGAIEPSPGTGPT